MTYQIWLKNLKKLKRTWMPRRNPLVHEVDPALLSGYTDSALLEASLSPEPKSFSCKFQPQQSSSLLDPMLPESNS
ncbi:Hypothetical predicted protein [Lynx pardinus]|uniref:Uncharacterized protein n=1 Tax=Lynx pardinus TaxID=191816 RepID=A0A485MKU6_LYNPA|nr:Hypothetical predicted protein [Lynx pardinus]